MDGFIFAMIISGNIDRVLRHALLYVRLASLMVRPLLNLLYHLRPLIVSALRISTDTHQPGADNFLQVNPYLWTDYIKPPDGVQQFLWDRVRPLVGDTYLRAI
jgi:hypothetical protein